MKISKQFYQSRKFDTIVGSTLEIWQNYSIFLRFHRKLIAVRIAYVSIQRLTKHVPRIWHTSFYQHTLNIYKGDMTILEPNICFHMIAVMQFGEWGVEASEAIRVTDQGAELFCNMSKELHVKSQLLKVEIYSYKCLKVD